MSSHLSWIRSLSIHSVTHPSVILKHLGSIQGLNHTFTNRIHPIVHANSVKYPAILTSKPQLSLIRTDNNTHVTITPFHYPPSIVNNLFPLISPALHTSTRNSTTGKLTHSPQPPNAHPNHNPNPELTLKTT